MIDPIDELRERFQSSARERLDEIRQLLDRLATDARDVDAVRTLLRHFHYFAGLGATCGFPHVSTLGDEGEASVAIAIDAAHVPAATLHRWRALIDAIGAEVSR